MSGINLSLQGQAIERIKVHRFLGVYLDCSLTWNHHIAVLEDKVNQRINVLRCFSGVLWG